MSDIPARILLAHRLTLAGIFALVLLGMLPAALESFSSPRWMLELASGIPVLLFVPFIKPAFPKRYAWLCFVILVYFCGGVLDAFTWPSRESLFGFANMTVTTWIFVASMMATRWAGQHLTRTQASNA